MAAPIEETRAALTIGDVTFTAPKPGEGVAYEELAPNRLSSSFTAAAKVLKALPESANVIIPVYPVMRVDWSSPSWFGIYEAAFKQMFKIPCHPLTRDILIKMNAAPFQLMPSAWRILHAVGSLSDKYNIGITVDDLRCQYFARGNKRGRVHFRVRSGKAQLITSTESDDKVWNSAWMFVEKASLGDAGSWIPEECIPAVEGWDGVNDDASKDRIDSFLAIPADERSWALDFANSAPVFGEPLVVEPISAMSASGQVITRRRGSAALNRQKMLRQSGQPVVIKQEVLPPSSRTRSNFPIPVPTSVNLPTETVTIDSDPEQSPAKRKRSESEPPQSEPSQSAKLKINVDADRSGAEIYAEHSEDLGQVARSMDGGMLKDQHACNLLNVYASGLTLGYNSYKYQDTCAALADSQSRLKLAKTEVEGLEARLAQMVKDLEAAHKKVEQMSQLEAALDESRLKHGQALSQLEQLARSVKEMEASEDSLGLYYSCLGRIEILRLPQGSVTLESELAEFKRLFPDCVAPGEEAEVEDAEAVQMTVDAGNVASASGLAPPQPVDGSAIPEDLDQTSAPPAV